ncbi:rho GTPase-activating protein 40 isoform X9 [Chelonia mydas]|nr:rho GTPase-activating protein 40 isoform X9 [Chelonia mydas]XP_043383029.1 rho GTPase-activating protein 40 isoform X9 [Chelonia mydas]XP_043383030.1 rho GTPase-activating protein 40 isoform X9 [Chelonia mydas]XP_043383031.1 rho GTPase-activating protein 40 isoform X9 [Chelonia mydas]XP_043383032.1 rho GTPase-activating protein 40 isoform X9 [Chelonia mydas]XP_043383033.1 rho GTPase-activating protein 40 isoform X9 [Chelonia mydas]
MSQFPQKSSMEPPLSECMNSRADYLDSLSMDNFWLEVENIKQSTEAEQEECNLTDVKTPEEGEAEAEWLQDAGLSDLIGDDTSDNDNVVLLSTLTKTQAAAVQRRLDTYSRSRRKKNKPPVRDVRDIFGVASSEEMVVEMEESDKNRSQHSVETSNYAQKPDSRGLQDFPCMLGSPGKEEIFCTDIAYSEQAAILLKGSFVRESRRIKDESALTQFKIPKGRLGVTRIGDLSPQDMKKIPTLALIELTALCDILGLELKRNKAAKQKAKENRLFGVPLSTLLENDQKLIPNTKVPLILQALLSCLEKKGLDTEGILRVSGSQTRIKSLGEKLESDFYTGLFRWDEVRQNDVSGLLKRFIRELPTPLLTAEYLPAFAAVQNIPDLKQRLQALNLLILILPEPNRNTLKTLLEFLGKVVAREKKNKMNLWNVSTVIAPNLFMHKGLANKIPEGKEKQLAEGAADVVRMMIHYQDLLWTISSFLVAQVRKLNESSSRRYQFYDKRIKNLLRKIHTDKDKVEKNQAEPSKTVKVQTSLLLKDSLEVHLNNGTKAADVLRQFQKHLSQNGWSIVNKVSLIKRNGAVESMNLLLYEVGGNISEHCLDPDTYLLDLYQINPHAEWIIKQNPSFPRML